MKTLTRLIAGLLMLLTATAAFGISDIGSPNVTRLWRHTPTGDRFTCTAFYVRNLLTQAVGDGFQWILSAGHCRNATMIKRNIEGHIIAAVTWQIIANSGNHGLQVVDFAIGTARDTRENVEERGFWIAEKFPEYGSVYIHSFPEGVERVTSAMIITPTIQAFTKLEPPSRIVLVRKGDVMPGSSGGPVLDSGGRVAGIVWGTVDDPKAFGLPLGDRRNEETTAVIVTPIERVIQAFRDFQPQAKLAP